MTTARKTIIGNRWLVAIILILLLALPVYFESLLAWNIITLAFMLVAAYEWGRLAGFSRNDSLLYAALTMTLALAGEWLFADAAVNESLWGAAVIFWAIIAPWWLLFRWLPPAVIVGAIGMLLLYAAWQAARLLYESDPYLLAAGLVTVWLFDAFSYFIGRLIGRTPMAQALSPKKTMEGFMGGVSAVFVVGVAYKIYYVSNERPLVEILALAFIISVLAMLGDLFESFIKRRAGVKDSGAMLGEHGGVLDRIDALLPVLPFVSLLSAWLA